MHVRLRNRIGNRNDEIPVVVFAHPPAGARLLALVVRQGPKSIVIHGGALRR